MDGLRVLAFVPSRLARAPLSHAFVTLLVLLDFALLIGLGRLLAGSEATFDGTGVGPASAGFAMLFLACALAGLLSPQQADAPCLGTALGALLISDSVWMLLELWPPSARWIDALWPEELPLAALPALWLSLALAWSWGQRYGAWWRRLAALAIAAALVLMPLSMLDRRNAFWLAAATDGDEAAAPEVTESLLYGEAARLDASLDALKSRQPGRINVYFVGFAGNGHQLVFMREVTFVRDLIEQRFSGPGHAVSLINSAPTAETLPLATVTSLRDSLLAVGERMSDDDVLVLFLSSHGSAEHGINVSLDPFTFDDLDPSTLRQLLDEAHIRQRVVIVSACYSGVFIPPLANDNTLVITAADATHTSFGCSNEADLTYFGRAYFAEGLAKTGSLTQAFSAAVPLIRAREDAQGFAHSNPQMSLGRSIEQTLLRLDRQRAGPGATP